MDNNFISTNILNHNKTIIKMGYLMAEEGIL